MMWMVESSSNEDEERRLKTEYGRKLRPLMPRPMMKMMMLPNSSSSSSSCSCIKNPNPLPLVSTRWNPTPEQLQALEDMYRRGVRTPSAEQIQHIASKLRRFGKIEGKNVFYWFQNHKARERQKKRRQLIHSNHTLQSSPGTGLRSSSRRSYIEIEDDQPAPCEDSASMQDGAVITPHLRQDEWTQLQLQLHHKDLDLDLHLQKKRKINNAKNEDQTSSSSNNNKAAPVLQDHNQTLHLFPIVASTSTSLDPIPHDAPSTIQTKFTPNQFIEFLPTKN